MGPSHPQDCASVDIGDCQPYRNDPGRTIGMHQTSSGLYGLAPTATSSPRRRSMG